MTFNRAYRIGKIELDHPFLLAPMAGISDSAFRRLCKEQGAALVYSEMISAKGLYYNDKATERLLTFKEEEKPIAYQLFGCDSEIMAWAVDKLSDRENSIIDINMGCPVQKVVKNSEGSALMKTPETAAKIVKAVVKAETICALNNDREPRPVSVKCRLGWDESNINIIEFALRIEDAGAAAITVHARTRKQLYSGKADWEYIADVKRKLSIPVIGSGDILSGEDANRILTETGCDFVMIARGALGNPWIFKDALSLFKGQPASTKPTLEDKLVLILRHLDMLAADKGHNSAVREMRKHISWYVKGIPGAAEIRRRVNKIVEIDELKDFLLQINSKAT